MAVLAYPQLIYNATGVKLAIMWCVHVHMDWVYINFYEYSCTDEIRLEPIGVNCTMVTVLLCIAYCTA